MGRQARPAPPWVEAVENRVTTIEGSNETMNKKISLSVLLTLAMVFTLTACGGQATMEGGTTDPGQIVEGDTGDNGDVTLDQLSDTNKTPVADEQEPYIVSLDDLPADLLGAFEYGYSTVHSEKPDLDEAERLEMELDLICQWCDSFVIAIPDNLNEVYSEWHAQYEAALNAIDEGGNTQSGSNTGTQSGTVDDITPPTNNSGNTNSSGGSQSSSGNTGSTSKPSTGSSNNGSGTSSGSSNSGSSNSGAPSKEELEAALGKPAKGTPGAQEGVGDGSGTTTRDPNDLTGIGGTISW